MAGKIKIADDLRPQQRDDVRADGEFESRKDFFGDSGAAEHVSPFQHEYSLARTSEIGGVGEAVVASSDDEDVVFGILAVGNRWHNFFLAMLTGQEPFSYRKDEPQPGIHL